MSFIDGLKNVGNFIHNTVGFGAIDNVRKEIFKHGQSVATDVMHMLGQNTAAEQNAFNAEQAQLNRDFQERMSNTSWQRGVADMQSAGMNSAMAYSQGGASVPSGSSASASQGGTALLSLLGAAIGGMSGVARAAVQANSAQSVAKLYNKAAMDRLIYQSDNSANQYITALRNIMKNPH